MTRFRLLSPPGVAAVAVLGSIPVRLLREPLSDPDLWWHLRTGGLIASTRSIPSTDPYSFTAAGKPWVVQEWGSEVILHWLREAFGLYGIFFFRAVMLLALYVLVARLLVRRMGAGMGTWVLLGLTAYAGAPNWTERPNLISFVLFALTLDMLERRSRAIWWFVPMSVVWANLHGMVIVGIGLIALVAAVEGLKVATRWQGADAARAKRLALVAAAGLAATLLNPAGPGLLSHALGLVGTVRGVVTEWGSPDFNQVGTLAFLVLLLVTIAALALREGTPDPTDVALTLAFVFLSLQAARNLAISSIVLGTVCAGSLPAAVARLRRGEAVRAREGPALVPAVALVVTLGMFAVLVTDGFPPSDRPEVIVERTYPIAAIDALQGSGARLFVLDKWSGLVIDRLWPDVHVYMDLRVDFYGRELVNKYRRAIAGLPGWDRTLDEACVSHVLIRGRDPLSQVLEHDPSWRMLREDDRSRIFARTVTAAGCLVRDAGP